jgi:hypothetical protein
MKTFLIKSQTSHQITENEFQSYWVEALFDENATLKEVKEWIESRGLSMTSPISISQPVIPNTGGTNHGE